jgi:hypothetical protein
MMQYLLENMGKRVKVNFVGDTPDVIGQLDGASDQGVTLLNVHFVKATFRNGKDYSEGAIYYPSYKYADSMAIPFSQITGIVAVDGVIVRAEVPACAR